MTTFLEIILPLSAFLLMGVVSWIGLRVMVKAYHQAAPDNVDATLYIAIGIFGAAQGYFSQTEAYQYINAHVLYWIKAFCVVGIGASTSLKAYRSGRPKKAA